MSIIIVNISPPDASLDGINDYELRINDHVVARFAHMRHRGLGDCLRQAAAAYDEAERERIANSDEGRAYRAALLDSRSNPSH